MNIYSGINLVDLVDEYCLDEYWEIHPLSLPSGALYSVKIAQTSTGLDVCFAHRLMISAHVANGR